MRINNVSTIKFCGQQNILKKINNSESTRVIKDDFIKGISSPNKVLDESIKKSEEFKENSKTLEEEFLECINSVCDFPLGHYN